METLITQIITRVYSGMFEQNPEDKESLFPLQQKLEGSSQASHKHCCSKQ
jgi:hemoglobin-like flavoprotein